MTIGRRFAAGGLLIRVLLVPLLTGLALPGPAWADGSMAATDMQAEILRELRALRSRVEQLETDNRELRHSLSEVESRPEVAAAPAPASAPADDGVTQIASSDTVGVTAGFDKNATNGFYIKSADDEFRLNIGAYTQLRYNANWRDKPTNNDEDFTQGFSMNRTRIFLEGKYTDNFKYHFRANINDSADFDLLTAYLTYKVSDQWNIRAGKQFMALSREDWMYAQDVLGLEFSANDFTFAIGPSIGLQADFTEEKYRFWAGVSNGAFGGEQSFPSVDSPDIAFTGRFEYQLVGADWSIWDDLVGRRGRPTGVLLGLAGGWQYDHKDDGRSPKDASEAIADISFNGNGYNALIAGTWLHVNPKQDASFNNYGVLAQGGYFLTNHLQAYSRYEWLSPGNEKGLDNFNSLSVGMNYFPFLRTNRWKFTGELGYLFSALNKTIVGPSGALGWLETDEKGQFAARFQAQMGF
jgi:hypothetical protein